jgi:hypothetical protein
LNKLRRKRWKMHFAYLAERGVSYVVLVGKPEGKSQLEN